MQDAFRFHPDESEPTDPRYGIRPWEILILLVLFSFPAYFIWNVLFGPDASTRARIQYTYATSRKIALSLQSFWEKGGVVAEYWGPLTGEIMGAWPPPEFQESEDAPQGRSVAIDPYNKDTADGPLLGGFWYNADRGSARITGSRPWFYSDGKGHALFLFKGPDQKRDFTVEDARSAIETGYSESLPNVTAKLYDPTNGTISGGDLIRYAERDER